MIDKTLRQFATLRQMEYLDAVEQHGTQRKAAAAIGVNRRTLERSLASLNKKAASRGWSPEHDMTQITAPGFGIKRISSLYNVEEAKLSRQWVISEPKKQAQVEAFLEAVSGSFADDLPRVPRIAAPRKRLDRDLEVFFPMGDPHVGMKAWAEEAGENFDLKIAEQRMVGAMADLVSRAPEAEAAVIVNIGDYFHSDTRNNRTEMSGHDLDTDGRWKQVMEVGINIMRTCIEEAARKFKRVKVVNALGNHDWHSAQALTLVLAASYEKNPRIEFEKKCCLFHYHHFGKNLIGITHGHTTKPAELGPIMAHDQRELWGQTLYRHWLTGHLHTKGWFDFPGCSVEVLRTLASADEWASRKYRSHQDMQAITFHREYGEVERIRTTPRMAKEAK